MYNTYASDYTTYERVNAQLKSNPNEGTLENDKAIVQQYIHVASDQIRSYCSRTFVPYIRDDAEVFYYQLSPYWILDLPDDGLVISQVAGTEDAVLPSDQYRVRDIYNQPNGFPFRWLEISRDSNIYINYTSYYFQPTFTMNGIWGYSRRSYANSWDTITTMAVSISATDTSIVVADSSLLETFDYIRIEDEFMKILTNDTDTNTITVTRAVNGSTAATHDGTGTPLNIDRWHIEDAVKDACTRLTAYLYTSRQGTGNTIVFQDGTVVSQYPALVWTSLFQYKRPVFQSV